MFRGQNLEPVVIVFFSRAERVGVFQKRPLRTGTSQSVEVESVFPGVFRVAVFAEGTVTVQVGERRFVFPIPIAE